jgi:hypothetical protein
MYMVVVACAGVAHTGFYSREKQLYTPVLQPVTLYARLGSRQFAAVETHCTEPLLVVECMKHQAAF